METMKPYYIWWTNQEESETADHVLEKVEIPSTIKMALNSRLGRAGRGRLWTVSIYEEVEVNPWPDTETGKECEMRGGIVFHAEDLPAIAWLPGIFTDMQLNPLPPSVFFPPAVIPVRVCDHCQEDFAPIKPGQVFCKPCWSSFNEEFETD